MIVLFLFFSLALVISFMCSLLESVILSVSHAYIALLIKKGRKSGHLLRRMKKNINHPLAVILTLNTVANTVGAAGVGAQTYSLFGSKWVAVSSATLTLLILVFSEIIPKTLGTSHWKRFAPVSAYILRGLIFLLYPVVKALEGISKFVSHNSQQKSLTREEMMVLAEIGESEGILLKKEARIIQNLLLLSEIHTEDILTPRSVVLAFNINDTIGDVVREHPHLQFSRIPVYSEGLDDIKGIVYRNELLETFYLGRASEKIEKLTKHLHAVPGSKSIADLLDEFIIRREHIFLVVDEYGGTAGIVTLEDAIETLLGVEIVDELDSVEDMRAYALERWKKRRKERFLEE